MSERDHGGIYPRTAAASTVCACGVMVPQSVCNEIEEALTDATNALQQETDKDGERLETENKLLRKLLRLSQSGRHIHVARETDRDTCASCGQNFRSEVHFRYGESKKTDAAIIDAAIAALPQKDGME